MLKRELEADMRTIGIGRRRLSRLFTNPQQEAREGVEVVVGDNDPQLRALTYLNIHPGYKIRLSPASGRFIQNLDDVIKLGYHPILVLDVTGSVPTIIRSLIEEIRERQVDKIKKIPLIVTAYPNSPHITIADRILYKPYHMDSLVSAIKSVDFPNPTSSPTGIELAEPSHWSPEEFNKELQGR